MDAPADRFDIARVLSRGLIEAADRVKADFAEIVGSVGLPPHLARAVLELDEPVPMSDLALRLACDRSYVTAIADGLEERGLIERAPGTDRRVKLLTLTPHGRDVRTQVAARIGERSVVLGRLTEEQTAALAPLLATLLEGDAPQGPVVDCRDA